MHLNKIEFGVLTVAISIRTARETHFHPLSEQTELSWDREIWRNSAEILKFKENTPDTSFDQDVFSLVVKWVFLKRDTQVNHGFQY